MVPGDGYAEQRFLKQLIYWMKEWIQGAPKPWK
jgi:hypothetical protein